MVDPQALLQLLRIHIQRPANLTGAGQRVQPRACAGRAQCGVDAGVVGVRAGKPDVLGQARIEQPFLPRYSAAYRVRSDGQSPGLHLSRQSDSATRPE